MCDYPFFIPQVVLFANSSLFWFKVTNEHREFRNYLNYLKTSCFVFPKYAHSNISCINYAPILLILSRSLHSGQEK